MASDNKAKRAEYRHRPDVQLRRRINRSMPTEVNAERKARLAIKAKLKKGY